MSKPQHRQCDICKVVTARYSHTNRQGPFTVKVWVRGDRGEVLTDGGFTVRCREHADR